MTSRQAEQLVDRLLAAFPQTPLREQTRDIYAKALADLEAEAAGAAVDDLIARSRQLPAIADIRLRVFEEALELPRPLEAYASIFERDPARAQIHPFTKRVADLFGGVYNIRTSESPSITRAQFLKTYEDFRDEEIRRASARGVRAAA